MLSASKRLGGGESLVNSVSKLVIFRAPAVTLSAVEPAMAKADHHIDFGANQAACPSAARQANTGGNLSGPPLPFGE
jgi:hypothetical protein